MPQRKTATKTSSKRSPSHSTKKPVAKASPKAKSSSGQRSNAAKARRTGDEEVTIDRRRAAGRRAEEGPASVVAQPAAPPLERRAKVNRRRQIDPTTCERDYTDAEVEFMNALDEYKRKNGRMFPTCSEVLEVVRSLGYEKVSAAQVVTVHADTFVTPAQQDEFAELVLSDDNLQ